ncbi:MAG: hypothetical protein CJBNEKGG_03872 [Prosthecobacter sp.]|nr:hypothetical protein [Prosthecobacter sp.]
MNTRILHLFTRTPLHVGAGASVGAIDQPVQRERHTGFPIIPASSLKGSFADHWNDSLHDEEADEGGKTKRVRVTKAGAIAEAAWLFGSDSDKPAFAGALLFSEARVLAFPIRSAKGSYAWITCPLMLQRAKRDGVISSGIPNEPKDDEAIFKSDGPLALSVKVKGVERTQIVLEEYTLTHTEDYHEALAQELAALPEDELFKSINDRLVILSNGMMSHFVSTTCDIAQHVRISDDTGTAEEGGLFNQENVPSETLFYSVLSATKSRVPTGDLKNKSADDALSAFVTKLKEAHYTFQFGGDASTGLGFCTVTLNPTKGA